MNRPPRRERLAEARRMAGRRLDTIRRKHQNSVQRRVPSNAGDSGTWLDGINRQIDNKRRGRKIVTVVICASSAIRVIVNGVVTIVVIAAMRVPVANVNDGSTETCIRYVRMRVRERHRRHAHADNQANDFG
jgi:hypothetical protein